MYWVEYPVVAGIVEVMPVPKGAVPKPGVPAGAKFSDRRREPAVAGTKSTHSSLSNPPIKSRTGISQNPIKLSFKRFLSFTRIKRMSKAVSFTFK
jgi:hypothetical protein